jgi:hypothetical protein
MDENSGSRKSSGEFYKDIKTESIFHEETNHKGQRAQSRYAVKNYFATSSRKAERESIKFLDTEFIDSENKKIQVKVVDYTHEIEEHSVLALLHKNKLYIFGTLNNNVGIEEKTKENLVKEVFGAKRDGIEIQDCTIRFGDEAEKHVEDSCRIHALAMMENIERGTRDNGYEKYLEMIIGDGENIVTDITLDTTFDIEMTKYALRNENLIYDEKTKNEFEKRDDKDKSELDKAMMNLGSVLQKDSFTTLQDERQKFMSTEHKEIAKEGENFGIKDTKISEKHIQKEVMFDKAIDFSLKKGEKIKVNVDKSESDNLDSLKYNKTKTEKTEDFSGEFSWDNEQVVNTNDNKKIPQSKISDFNFDDFNNNMEERINQKDVGGKFVF